MSRVPPPRVADAVSGVRRTLRALARVMVPPEIALLELTSGFMATHAIYAAARLRIADVLEDGPLSSDDIAARCGTDPDATHRLLRACATFSVFGEDAAGRFKLTPLAGCLRSGTPDSMRPVILMLGDPHYQQPWGQLARAVETGRPVAHEVLGMSMWDYLDHDPVFAATFNDAMTQLTALDWPAIDAAYDFSRFSTIVDIGGGYGQLLSLILGATPPATGVLLEREVLVGAAEEHLRATGVLPRCRIEGGSFFGPVPSDGDLYLLRRVIHDFDDEQAVAILTNVRHHMPQDSTLLLLESVVPPGNAPHLAKALDLDMLLFVGGRERTAAEFATVLDRAGFRAPRVIPTVSTISVIESAPARRS